MSIPNELESQMIANSLSKIFPELSKDLINQLASMLIPLMEKEKNSCKEITKLYSEYQNKVAAFETDITVAKKLIERCGTDDKEIRHILERNASSEIIQRHLSAPKST
jgi:hypothetical protein